MNAPTLPPDGSIIEMTAYGETVPEVRVVRTAGAVITLSMALDHVPPDKADVQLRWAAAPRGRVAREGHVRSIDGNRVEVYFTGRPMLLQSRLFVRGGGGEQVVMHRPRADEAAGVVHDMSERAIRAQFTDIKLEAGEVMQLAVQIDDGLVEVAARALKVNSIRQQVPEPGPLSVEMVALFDSEDEVQAQRIRQYIMRHQLIARQRGL